MTSGISYLNSLPVWRGDGGFTLEVPSRLLSALGNPQDKIKTVHVAGTNGKGSVSAYITATLHEAGYRVAQYSSPPLTDVTERLIVNGHPISIAILDKALLRIKQVSAELSVAPSHFEAVTAAAFLIMQEEQVDWAVIEVGLGGRLDATNTITKPELSVITSISLDHTEILGDSIAAIAAEKAGILKSTVPALVGRVSSEAREVIAHMAKRVTAPLEFLDVPESADYLSHNRLLAVRAAEKLGISAEVIARGLARAQWPGRLERIGASIAGGKSVDVVLDAAHNPDGIEALLSWVGSKEGVGEIVFLVSILERHDWRKMLDALLNFAKDLEQKGASVELIFTRGSAEQGAVEPESMQDHVQRGEAVTDPHEALRAALALAAKRKNSLVIVTGSIYLLGMLRPELTKEPFRTIV